MKKLLCTILFLSVGSILNAQPGWQDFTQRINYLVRDGKNKNINFTQSPQYTIIIEGKKYSGKHIPKDTFSNPIRNKTSKFSTQITVNDFKLELPGAYKHTIVTIVHKKDTMHLLQHNWRRANIPLNLCFSAGYYYLTNIASNYISQTYPLSSQFNIINRNQDYFKVDSKAFQEYFAGNADSNIVDQQRKTEQKFLHMSHTKTPIIFENPLAEDPTTIQDVFYPTADPNVLMCFTVFEGYNPDKSIITTFDKSKNSMRYWLPDGTPDSITYTYILPDTFNRKYLGIVQVSYKPERRKVYESSMDSLDWKFSADYTKLFSDPYFYFLPFLDREHLIGYRMDTLPKPRGTSVYYLFKNRHLVDSMRMQKPYNTNVNRFVNKDTFVLSHFTYDIGNQFDLALVKQNDKWEFKQVVPHQRVGYGNYSPMKQKQYNNFYVRNDSVFLKQSHLYLTSNYNTILERDSMIVVVSTDYLLFSFDIGNSWFYYPGQLGTQQWTKYDLWEINDNRQLAFCTFRNGFCKYVYEVRPIR